MVCIVQAMVFQVVMYGCESWTVKKAEYWRIDAFEQWCWRRLLRVPWTARSSNQSILKDESWVFIGGTDVDAETPILWPVDAESWLIWKDPDAGKDWGQEEKETTEDELIGWHHRHNGHGFGWTPRVDDGQGGLVYCGLWGRKESDTTERLNWTKNSAYICENSLLKALLFYCLCFHPQPIWNWFLCVGWNRSWDLFFSMCIFSWPHIIY